MFLIPKIVFFISREQDQFSIFASIVYKQKFTRIKAQKESRSVEKLLIVNPPPSITRRKGSSKCSLTRCWNKSSLIFSKSCPRVSTVAYIKSAIFQNRPKVALNILTVYVTRFVQTTFKIAQFGHTVQMTLTFAQTFSVLFIPFATKMYLIVKGLISDILSK